jgi:hypothetical protein
VRRLPDHRLIDRLVRGRAWIPVLGLMLAGIVAMQVEVLKLGADVGRSIETGSTLQTRNELLRASVASLSDQNRIERLAAGMGMVMPPPGSAGFLSSASVSQAIANIHAPDPSAFLTSTTGNGAVATSGIMSTSNGAMTATPQTQSATGSTSAGATSAGTTSAGTTSAGTTSAATPTSQSAATTSSTPSSAAVPSSAVTQSSQTPSTTPTGG